MIKNMELINQIGILPTLSVEFDKDFAVTAESINKSALGLLEKSGYKVIHCSYFSIYNRTRRNYSINPYKKYVMDAAKIDSIAISFKSFLELFENQEIRYCED